MRTLFSKTWNSSVQPRKQRKFAHNAPLHIRAEFLNVHLDKKLQDTCGTRSLKVRKDDTVKILRGMFKGKSGKVDRVNIQYTQVYVAGIGRTKGDGLKKLLPVHPSNLIITDLNLSDKTRLKHVSKDKTTSAPKAKKVVKDVKDVKKV